MARLRAPMAYLPLLDRYVLRQLLVGLAGSTGGLVALIWLTQSTKLVSTIVDHGLSLRVFLTLSALLMPYFAAVILPITTFLVVLFGYQRMAGDRELTVMRAAGLSPFELARPGVLLAIGVTAACYVLNIWIVPASQHAFRQDELAIGNRLAASLVEEGIFNKISPQMTVYVRARDADGTLHGILVEDDRDADTHATILARHGAILTVGDQPRVVLYEGSREEIDRKTGRLNVLTFARNTVDLTGQKRDQSQMRDVSEMSMSELLSPVEHDLTPQARGKRAVEGWRRLTTPLTAFSFAMIGLFAILRGAFSRHGSITRPLFAILSVVGLLALSLTLQNLASRNLAMVPLMWIAAVMPGLVCVVVLFTGQILGRGARS